MIHPVRDDVLGWVRGALGGRPVPAVVVVIGLGDGAVLDVLAALRPDVRILAFEPDPAAAHRVQATVVEAASAASPRVRLFFGPGYAGADDAWRLLADDPDDHAVLIAPAAAAANREGALAAARVFGRLLFGARANAEARRKFAPGYLHNTLANLGAIARGARADAVDGCWAGRPAVVVGAGPSLDRVLPALAELASRAVVITTDTALRPLLHAGVSPEVVAGADPSETNGRHFENLPPCDDTWLVAESALDPRAAAAFPGRTAWFRVAAHEPWPWANGVGLDVPIVDMWGSVLTAAWQLALRAGCDPIVFVGADLAFTGGRPYARGTTYEFDWAYSAKLGTPIAEAWRQQIAMSAGVTVPGVDGQPVASSQPLQAFRDWLVTQAARSGRRVVNATGGGILAGPAVVQRALGDELGGRPRLPRATFPPRPTTGAAPSQLADAIATVRAAIARSDRTDPALARWTAFTGAALDLPAIDAALRSSVERLERQSGAPTPLAAAHVPWSALAAAGFPLTRLGALPEDVLAPRDDDTPPHERIAQALVAGSAAAAALTTAAPDPPMAATPAHPADPRQLVWPAAVSWPLRVLDALCPAPVPGAPVGFLEQPVAGSASGASALAPPSRVLRDRLVARLMQTIATAASAVDAARLRGLATAIEAGPAGEDGRRRETVSLVVDGSAGYRARVSATPTRRAAARALTGTIVTAGAADGEATLVAWRHRALDARLVCASAVAAVRPDVLTDRGLPRAAALHAHDGGAVVVPLHGTTSLRLDAAGAATPHLTWPLPIVGELPMGEGAVAWSNGTARFPDLDDGYVLWRARASDDVVHERLPFRPTAGAWFGGRLHWTLFRAGLGVWTPGAPAAQCFARESFVGLRVDGDHLLLSPLDRDAEGKAVRRVHTRGWRLDADGRRDPVEFGPEGGSVARASGARWTACAYPDADEVRLTAGADAFALVCHAPMALAWIGPTLFVGAAPGDVIRFDRLAETLDGLL